MKWPRITFAESQRSRPDLTERGDNAISCSTSRKRAEQRLRDLDHNYEWRGPNKWRICDRMRKSDPKIAGLRSAQTLPLLRTEAQITGSEDKEKVEFVRKALLEDFPWRAFLQSVATYVDYGFAAFAVNWRIDDDDSARIDELRYLPPSSIRTENIHVSRGSIARIVQTPTTGAEQEVPGEYLLWFAHAKEGDDFTGRPILRAMHKPWFTKERLEVLLPVLVEKMGGVPVFTEQVPLSEEQRAVIDEMGESFVIGERQYIRKPSDVDFELVESHVNVADILEAIRYFDTQLTDVCQAQYLDLGVNQAGSRAYGTTLARHVLRRRAGAGLLHRRRAERPRRPHPPARRLQLPHRRRPAEAALRQRPAHRHPGAGAGAAGARPGRHARSTKRPGSSSAPR